VPVRTFADWNEPPPGSMEMDCVAHCGDANRGSYFKQFGSDRHRRAAGTMVEALMARIFKARSPSFSLVCLSR
jgi:hypothetical protein